MIWGENGSGKTSVLEAIHTLSLGKSFRTHMQKSLIKNGEDGFLIKGHFFSKRKESVIATQLIKKGSQQTKINGKKPQSTLPILAPKTHRSAINE